MGGGGVRTPPEKLYLHNNINSSKIGLEPQPPPLSLANKDIPLDYPPPPEFFLDPLMLVLHVMKTIPIIIEIENIENVI